MKPVLKPLKKITYIQLLLLHLGMAFLVYTIRSTSLLFFLGIIIYFLIRIISSGNKKDEVLLAAAYITGYEVFSRMTGGTITYEFAKYTVIGFLVIGMLYKGFNRKSWAYLFFILFLIPGIFFSVINLNYETNVLNAIGFNLSGPVCLAITALYCYNRRISSYRLQGILLALLLPIITLTFYLYLYTPSIREVITGTAPNFATSGGYGPNQVATVLGLGMFILFSRLFINKSRLVNIIDLALLIFVSYRAIVTFSRGGVIVALIVSIAFLAIYFMHSEVKEKASLVPKIIFITVILIMTWIYSSITTMGMIDKRYANQDSTGKLKGDISTGRLDLINTELEAFYEYPFTGVGVGKTKEYRYELTGEVTATHNEMSRMLSEHGIFGLIALLILIFSPLIFRLKDRSNVYLFSFLLFWFLTINHSSMRIAAPAFIYGLALISIIHAKKNTLHR